MNAVSEFGKGGCFKCKQCGRKTRNTGKGCNADCSLCGDCYEQIITEEQIVSEGQNPRLIAKRQRHIDACRRKGGNPDSTWYLARIAEGQA